MMKTEDINAHDFQRTRLTGVTVCAKCKLIPLDANDYDIPCDPAESAMSNLAGSIIAAADRISFEEAVSRLDNEKE